jgi:ABC-type Fe3+ transport system substrate-binding protein
MRDVNRRDFLKLSAAAVAASSLLELAEQATSAFAAKSKLPPPTPLKTLAKKGQAEGGQLLVYLGSSDLADGLSAGFKKAYPWATVNTVVSSTGAILSKVLTEVNAGKGADVYSCTPVQPYLFIRAKAAAPVLLVNDANLKDAADPSGYRHPYAQNVQVLAVNPGLASYVPRDIYELMKPTYKGNLSIDRPANLGTGALFLASQRKAWGDKKWFGWLQGLQQNNLFIAASATATYQAVLTGERGIGTASIGDILSQPAGAPVKASFYKNAPPYRQCLMKTSYAANPNMAELFMNWVLSPAGQQVIVSTNRTPAVDLPGAATSVSTLVPKAYPIAPYSQVSGFVFNPQPYSDIFNKYWPS